MNSAELAEQREKLKQTLKSYGYKQSEIQEALKQYGVKFNLLCYQINKRCYPINKL